MSVAPHARPLVLAYPFSGRWRTENSPARRVPSHGTALFGTSHAIDFVAVDARGRSGPITWRTVVATEPPETYVGFGLPITAPVAGTVVEAADTMPDHEGRRSQLALVRYALGQPARARAGVDSLAGNRVVIAVGPEGPYVVLAHLRRESVRVDPGQRVEVGELLGECGNSGNSTEPHVHVQVSDSADWPRARGVPLAFLGSDGTARVPAEREIVVS
ncbi:M23 family metallopeptidase [Georgenia muralis]|uniref:Peptidase M23-like protein n=1 Tax=Georgenia muralis TaxID=154117 RepID=A0A3N4Z698_9MICO|nr:M23 family metallopeptidase [Georgenia muralis]RPF28919.1 peptidase M23-like protein [Georgenia muralis]